MPNYEPIEQEIIDALNAFAPYAVAHGIHDNRRWTLADAGLIGAIGRRGGYTFCAAGMFCSYQGNRLGFHFELYVAP